MHAFGRGTDLHVLWDRGLIARTGLSTSELAARLAAAKGGNLDLDTARVAGESCWIVGTDGFYPDCRLDDSYMVRYTPVLMRLLALASARLARLLNRIFR